MSLWATLTAGLAFVGFLVVVAIKGSNSLVSIAVGLGLVGLASLLAFGGCFLGAFGGC